MEFQTGSVVNGALLLEALAFIFLFITLEFSIFVYKG